MSVSLPATDDRSSFLLGEMGMPDGKLETTLRRCNEI